MDSFYMRELIDKLTDISDSIACLTLEIDHLRDDIKDYNETTK